MITNYAFRLPCCPTGIQVVQRIIGVYYGRWNVFSSFLHLCELKLCRSVAMSRKKRTLKYYFSEVWTITVTKGLIYNF
jgi:hypothetical protein